MKYLILVVALLLSLNVSLAQTPTHQAVLSWAASPTTGVTGYNVYRIAGACPASPSLSAFTKLGSTTSAVLTYTDATITAGSTYCYAVTAFNTGGESGFSGTLQATVPVFTASTVPSPPGALSGPVQ